MKKRILSALLAFCMVLTLLPAAAFASDSVPDSGGAVTTDSDKQQENTGNNTTDGDQNKDINTVQETAPPTAEPTAEPTQQPEKTAEEVFLEAISKSGEGEEVVVSKNLNLKGAVAIGRSVTIKINNGVTITTEKLINIGNNNVTIQGGTITRSDGNVTLYVDKTGSLTLKNVKVINDKVNNGEPEGMSVYTLGGNVDLTDCTITSNCIGVAVMGDADITMTNGSITSRTGVLLSANTQSNFTMTGGRIVSTGKESNNSGISCGSKDTSDTGKHEVTINNGEITGEFAGITVLMGTTATVKSGTVYGKVYGMSTNGRCTNTVMNVEGGTVEGGSAGIYGAAPITAAISGGEVKGPAGIVVRGCKLTVSGDAKVTGTGQGVTNVGNGKDVTSSAIVLDKSDTGYDAGSTVSITGGKITSVKEPVVKYYPRSEGETSFTITGGTFSYNPFAEGDNPTGVTSADKGAYQVKNNEWEIVDPYTVTINALKNDAAAGDNSANVGTVTPSGLTNNKAFPGEEIALTVTAETGYVLKEIKAVYTDGEQQKELTVSADYKFTMPKGDVTVTAIFDELDVTELSVVPVTGTILTKNASEIQSNIVIAKSANTFTFTGTSSYVFDWTQFRNDDEKNDGNFLAIKLASSAGATIKVADGANKEGVTLDSTGEYVVILDGSNKYKTTVTVSKEVGPLINTEIRTATYTLDFSKVVRKPAEITEAENSDKTDGSVKAEYKNGKIYLSGEVKVKQAPTTPEEDFKEIDPITLTVKFGSDPGVTKETEVTLTKSGSTFTAKADPAVLGDNTLAFDTTKLFEAKETAAEASAVAAPTVDTSKVTGDGGGTQQQIEAAADSLGTALEDKENTKIDEDILAAYAAKEANEANSSKKDLMAKAVNTTKQEAVPSDLWNTVKAATEPNASSSEQDKVTTVVQVYTEIKVDKVTVDDKGSLVGFKVQINPKAQTLVTTVSKSDIDEGKGEIKPVDVNKTVDENVDANAIPVGRPKDITISESTEVKLKMPGGFPEGTTYITHRKSDGKTYIYKGTVEGGVLTFTSEHGFSEFDISTKNPAVAEVKGVGYATLSAAISAANNGDTITLTGNCTGAAATAYVPLIAEKTLTFTGQNVTLKVNGKDYEVTTSNTSMTVLPKNSTGDDDYNYNPIDLVYSVTLPTDDSGKGTVSASTKSAKKGDTVTITPAPAENYRVAKVTVKAKDGLKVDVIKGEDGTYTYIMPESKVDVNVLFVSNISFNDVNADAYYADPVAWAMDMGITTGKTDEHFAPNDSCTRAEIMTFLWRAAGKPEVESSVKFTDVEAGSYYEKAVAWAVANGITTGKTDEHFAPNDPCTRAQAMTFLHRYEKTPAAASESSFNDVADDAYYAGAVAWAVEKEITNGKTDEHFAPNDSCTRGQIVTFLYRDMT